MKAEAVLCAAVSCMFLAAGCRGPGRKAGRGAPAGPAGSAERRGTAADIRIDYSRAKGVAGGRPESLLITTEGEDMTPAGTVMYTIPIAAAGEALQILEDAGFREWPSHPAGGRADVPKQWLSVKSEGLSKHVTVAETPDEEGARRTKEMLALVARLREFAGRVGRRSEAPGATAQPPVAWGEAVNGLQLGIARKGGTGPVPFDGLAPLRVHVRNVGGKPFLFPRLPAMVRAQGCVMLEAFVGGKRPRPRAQGTPGAVRPEDYTDLAPGATDSADIKFGPYASGLNVGEKADVVFVLNSRSFSVKWDPVTKKMRKTAGAWHGKARSGVVEIEVGPEAGPTLPRLGVTLEVRDRTRVARGARLGFTTATVRDMQLRFIVTNQTGRAIDPGLQESRLLVNGQPLRGGGDLPDWSFIIANGPRDDRWRRLPPRDRVSFGYAMGRYFTTPGLYRIVFVIGGVRSNTVEIEVAAKGGAAAARDGARRIPASSVRFLMVEPQLLGEKRSGLYCVGWLPDGGKYSYPHLFRDAADGKPPRHPARARYAVTLVGKLPGHVLRFDFFEAQEGSIKGGSIDIPARFVIYRGPTDKPPMPRDVYVVAHLPPLDAGRYRSRITFEDFRYENLRDRTKIKRSPPERPFRFAPLTCEFEVRPATAESATKTPQLSPRKRLARAEKAFGERRYDDCLAEAKEALVGADEEEADGAYSMMGKAYEFMGDLESAIRMYRRAIEIAKKHHPKGSTEARLGPSIRSLEMRLRREGPRGKAPAVAWGKTVNGLRIGLEATRGKYALGEPILLRVHMKNISGRPLPPVYVRTPHFWDASVRGKGARRLRRPPGPGPVDPSSLRTIPPDQTKVVDCRLSRLHAGRMWRIAVGGRYRISVSYEVRKDLLQNRTYLEWIKSATGRELPKDLWRGKVTTGVVEIEVAPKGAAGEARKRVTTDEAVVEIARSYCRGRASIPADCPVRVRREGGRYVVTFVYVLPPGRRGPDYHAQVTIDADTGKVLKILAGS